MAKIFSVRSNLCRSSCKWERWTLRMQLILQIPPSHLVAEQELECNHSDSQVTAFLKQMYRKIKTMTFDGRQSGLWRTNKIKVGRQSGLWRINKIKVGMVCMCVLVTKLCPTVVTPWIVAHQAPLSMGFSRQEYWSGLPFPSPGDLPDPGIEPRSPTLQADALTSEPPGKPLQKGRILFFPLGVTAGWCYSRRVCVRDRVKPLKDQLVSTAHNRLNF